MLSQWPVRAPPGGHNNLPDLPETCARESTASNSFGFHFALSWDAGTRRHKPFLEPRDAFHTHRPSIHTSTTFFVTLWWFNKGKRYLHINIGHCLNLLIHVRVQSSNWASLTSFKHQRNAGEKYEFWDFRGLEQLQWLWNNFMSRTPNLTLFLTADRHFENLCIQGPTLTPRENTFTVLV